MTFYIFMFKPFAEKLLNFSNALTEICITIIFCFVAVPMFEVEDYYEELVDKILVYLVNSIMGIQMVGSLAIFVKTVVRIVKEKRLKRNAVRPTNFTIVTTNKAV